MTSKNKYRFWYKQFVELRENVQNRKKVFNFKKKKWAQFVEKYRSELKKKIKFKDHAQYIVTWAPRRYFSYKRRYKFNKTVIKKLKLFYGYLSEKHVKKCIRQVLNQKSKTINNAFLSLFESRLDTILYRAQFAISMKSAQQLILQSKIIVNDQIINTKSYKLKQGDIIKINSEYHNFIWKNIKTKASEYSVRNSKNIFVPPKYLMINYKTLQIIFEKFEATNLSSNFYYHRLNVEKILINKYH